MYFRRKPGQCLNQMCQLDLRFDLLKFGIARAAIWLLTPSVYKCPGQCLNQTWQRGPTPRSSLNFPGVFFFGGSGDAFADLQGD